MRLAKRYLGWAILLSILWTQWANAADHFFMYPGLSWYPAPLQAPQTNDTLTNESVTFRCWIWQVGGGSWELDPVIEESDEGYVWNGVHTSWMSGFDTTAGYVVVWAWVESTHAGRTNPYLHYTASDTRIGWFPAGTRVPVQTFYPDIEGPF